jgi:hypothetical protein
MQQSPSWEANWFLASQEIPSVLLDPMVQYSIHSCPPPLCTLSQPNPFHTPISHFMKINSNIILPFTPGSPQWSLSLRFLHQNPSHTSLLSHPHYMTRPPLFSILSPAQSNILTTCHYLLEICASPCHLCGNKQSKWALPTTVTHEHATCGATIPCFGAPFNFYCRGKWFV